MDNADVFGKRVPFRSNEKKFLLSLIRKFPILEDRSGGLKVLNDKRDAWVKIASLYNESSMTYSRTEHQLKRCWENMKASHRKTSRTNEIKSVDLDSQYPLDIEVPLLTGGKIEMCDGSDSDTSEMPAVTATKDSVDIEVSLSEIQQDAPLTTDTSHMDQVVLTEGELRMKLLYKVMKHEEELHKYKVMKEKLTIEREKVALEREKILLLRAKKSLDFSF